MTRASVSRASLSPGSILRSTVGHRTDNPREEYFRDIRDQVVPPSRRSGVTETEFPTGHLT